MMLRPAPAAALRRQVSIGGSHRLEGGNTGRNAATPAMGRLVMAISVWVTQANGYTDGEHPWPR
jgi:hypothetical protein